MRVTREKEVMGMKSGPRVVHYILLSWQSQRDGVNEMRSWPRVSHTPNLATSTCCLRGIAALSLVATFFCHCRIALDDLI